MIYNEASFCINHFLTTHFTWPRICTRTHRVSPLPLHGTTCSHEQYFVCFPSGKLWPTVPIATLPTLSLCGRGSRGSAEVQSVILFYDRWDPVRAFMSLCECGVMRRWRCESNVNLDEYCSGKKTFCVNFDYVMSQSKKAKPSPKSSSTVAASILLKSSALTLSSLETSRPPEIRKGPAEWCWVVRQAGAGQGTAPVMELMPFRGGWGSEGTALCPWLGDYTGQPAQTMCPLLRWEDQPALLQW